VEGEEGEKVGSESLSLFFIGLSYQVKGKKLRKLASDFAKDTSKGKGKAAVYVRKSLPLPTPTGGGREEPADVHLHHKSK